VAKSAGAKDFSQKTRWHDTMETGQLPPRGRQFQLAMDAASGTSFAAATPHGRGLPGRRRWPVKTLLPLLQRLAPFELPLDGLEVDGQFQN
jgi:hypothetical protein